MSSFLEIDKLNVQINDKEILSDVSINIKEVAKIGLIGESGAGKSLFAMCILDSEHEYKASKNYLNFGRLGVFKLFYLIRNFLFLIS